MRFPPLAAQEMEEIEDYHNVTDLESAGINAAHVKKLQAAGIQTVEGVLMTPRRKLQEIKGFSEAVAGKLCDNNATTDKNFQFVVQI